MAKPPSTKPPRVPRAAAATTASTAPAAAAEMPPPGTPPEAPVSSIAAELAEGDTIRMLVGQEGPTVSRAPGQLLVVGTDLDSAEAKRLVDVDFAELA